MTNNPPEIDKYDTKDNGALQKRHSRRKMPKGYLPRTELNDFRKGILKYVTLFRLMVLGF